MSSRYIFKGLKECRRNFFQEHYIPLLFHRLTSSSTKTFYKIQARCVSLSASYQQADIFRLHNYRPGACTGAHRPSRNICISVVQ